MPLPQIKSGLVQSVTPSQRSELYQSDTAGGEKDPGVAEDVIKAQNDLASQFATALEADAYNGQNCFGVYDKDEELNGDGLTP